MQQSLAAAGHRLCRRTNTLTAPAKTLVITNIGELVTMLPLALSKRCTGISESDLGRLGPHAWLAIQDGRIDAVGTGPLPATYQGWSKLDAHGQLVLPGLVDSHTHALFAGSRAAEFWLRAAGASYQDIAQSGGGIRATMTATRDASLETLERLLDLRLERMLRHGVTTVEVKSGYGLSVPEELRLLRLLSAAKQRTPQTLKITCLALHAPSPEHSSRQSYVDACRQELLPMIAAEGLASSVDAFIDEGYFSTAEVDGYMRAAKDLGLGLRLHADEFTDAGAAAAAASWGAHSADHLQCATPAAIARMAAAGVTATILPGTSLYTRIPFTDARSFADHGVAVAIASDYNPGSCAITNLPLLTTVACMQNRLRPAEAIAAVTYVPACSLDLGHRKGALAPGFDADLLVFDLPDAATWLAAAGERQPAWVLAAGQVVSGPALP